MCIRDRPEAHFVLQMAFPGPAPRVLGDQPSKPFPAVQAHPDSAWVTQQARNLALDLDARASSVRFFIRDRDTKFSRSFDQVIRSEGARVIVTPVQAPNANAHAVRVIETIRAECLDWTLIQSRHSA